MRPRALSCGLLVLRGNDGAPAGAKGKHGQGSHCPGQSERLKPDPRHRAQVSQVATNRPAGAHDRTGPKRWTGSVEQDLHAEGIGTATLRGVGSRPMPFAPNLTIEQVGIERR